MATLNNEIYKVYQLMEFFICKYGYENVLIKQLTSPNEVWVVNRSGDVQYSTIRISMSTLDSTFSDKERINQYISTINQNIKSSKFLDIHISLEDVTEMESYPTVCMNTNSMKGEDIKPIFPGIDRVIHNVDNPEIEISSRINAVNIAMKEKIKRRYKVVKGKLPISVTNGIILVCAIMSLIATFMSLKYGESYTYLLLGGDYKIFTIYGRQFYRLFTYAFLHGGIFHLFMNMYVFLSIGNIYEEKLGKIKYIIVLLTGIFVGGLTHNIFSPTTLSIGMSGAIYTLFSMYIIEAIYSGAYRSPGFMTMIMINVMLNFMPGVAWQTHLGGALVGFLYYQMFKDEKINRQMIFLLIVLIVMMFVKLLVL